ncbi:isoprenylcysteine carboxyl methyltransferase [Candidatus Daviesbacteria bacterium RIFCSPHIGHO2_01_FULL_40_24]|uniref:Isoprenylcysteine carboxyl methyltransferase n=1 Tax=Candidatus Daviesbacteria bacterium GW2011_GWC2_40_12 TaxID=1618431 RepID=A0A0G0T6Q6_9BACT|nr:MAG: Isoprenylcysteine carboxyl methyltransferase [Candidatus Daviesbacteria bacterium GW2011_GWA2_39_33]KKR42800.1 MAG: Isoprenylcysteine carboxyl methyltransferase [Candidatus Daviesbacteria bacterium GW2011_GWC2_40_12]OGE21621.1 MAG: isoprenylcysteine carboxyl methyltransferase [Candidatus Daviesbacteria bacterium RIFCSPHIGHO2_01_FULL_40_24]OGE30018.1 MAG: isoprenylcysteine carboxyl methyltransferase [Candidatus Daviesbacteria bacterium RIFCSPHIGHO2_02_FULL_40_16]OGE43547.1 MAG: isoprenyl
MEYAYGNWFVAITLSVVFLVFAYQSFKPRTGVDWRSFGAFSAFIIALFTEMYGFPLTIYLLSSWLGNRFPQINFSHNSGHLWEDLLGNTGDPHFSILHILSYILIIGGLILISASWKILYQATRRQTIARTGPYKYIRHPQYVGFVVIILGFLMQWPTLPTLIMAPVLTFMYIRLSRKEEREVLLKHPEYQHYLKNTPAFLPSAKSFKLILAYGKR